ncbi:MAG: prepilin-type N-terminal cleavage/methylation domain-containing protein [Gemmatimonadota bacterium]|nr:prepilin-type N-terminal cleavage/methylation domain-containing protein [Gemmatimonadota bacterium]
MRARRGFTLIEIIISMTLLMIITGAAVQFLRKQTGLVTRETSRMDAMQNAQFAGSQIERELREAGAGVADAQPMIVQLDSQALTFNANMVSVDTGDVRAVYQLRDADTNGTRAMLKSERVSLPNSVPAVFYPDTTYIAATGIESGAETISYFLRSDSTTTRTNDYLLFRRLNAQPASLIARGIVRDPRDTIPFFTYYKSDTLNRLRPILKSQLPLYHGMTHGAANDTGRFALTDSIKAVRVHFMTATKDPRTGIDALRTVETTVRIMNSGLLDRSSCGQPPYPTPTPTVLSSLLSATPKFVKVTWGGSTDDKGGEKDIERYAIFRKLSGAAAFGDPISSIPSSLSSTYTFTDYGVTAGETYVYGVAAQDCTPSLSPVTSSLAVTVLY